MASLSSAASATTATATTATATATDSPFDGYIEWCRTALGATISNKLEVRDVPPDAAGASASVLVGEGERGVYASAPIEPNETLVSMPFDSLFTVAAPLMCSPESRARAQLLAAGMPAAPAPAPAPLR